MSVWTVTSQPDGPASTSSEASQAFLFPIQQFEAVKLFNACFLVVFLKENNSSKPCLPSYQTRQQRKSRPYEWIAE